MTFITKTNLGDYEKEEAKKIRAHIPEGFSRPINAEFRPSLYLTADPASTDDDKPEVALTISHMRYRSFTEQQGKGIYAGLTYEPANTHVYLTPKQARKLAAGLTAALVAVENGREYGYDD